MPSAGPTQEEVFLGHERSRTIHECVREAVQKVDARERFIVQARMMADSPDELSLAEIGRRLGVSRERARQLETRAKQKIKRHLEARAGELGNVAA